MGCEVGDAAEEMVRRLCTGAGFAETSKAAGIDALPDIVHSMKAKDAAFGRLFVSMDWHSAFPVDAHNFEVPVHAVGKCPWHPHPVSYALTTEDDIYVVIIPWAGI